MKGETAGEIPASNGQEDAMAQAEAKKTKVDELRHDPMMAHLLDSLEQGKDVGHYGRLVFTLVARHFMDEDELVEYLCKDSDCDETKARALIRQVEARDYNPPRRERIIEWMQEQGFPICPDSDDPDACNVYKDLKFPHEVYENIGQYREAKAEAREPSASTD